MDFGRPARRRNKGILFHHVKFPLLRTLCIRNVFVYHYAILQSTLRLV